MFGINGTEMLIIVIVALLVIGPQRLPEYAEQLKEFVKLLKRRADEAKGSLRRDFAEDLPDVDWKTLDPRQYDPRRIVREALQEESQVQSPAGSRGANPGGSTGSGTDEAAATQLSPVQRYRAQAALRDAEAAPPFDPEAT
ncbi:twin-arginine translocase TatA/TatE family subunit [Brevibacterium luteolum]|uniref:Preprotein translocase subunit TatB n=1 Tax=Brevibacterium luteolum TaxID=199591 RepID=A0A2N6PFA0_9MICO|nr:twin-arginine translocase TatA/TatE family subunit [Brevibacterium luteolum]PMB97360.1 preprotein translocase subunit TatB [Brevibacterium luteolum]